MKSVEQFKELSADDLYQKIDPKLIPFKDTDSCHACDIIIGQDRALKSIQTGLDIKSRGYNIFITGMVGTGRTTTIKRFLEKIEKPKKTPDDMLYVNNFKSPDEPCMITLPAGKGKQFQGAMNQMVEVLQTDIPGLLKNKYYTEKRDQIIESRQKIQKRILQAFEDEVAKEGFSVVQVQIGTFVKPDLIPIIEDKPAPFEKLNALAKEGKFDRETLKKMRKKYEDLTGKLELIFKQMKENDEKTREMLRDWDRQSIAPIIKNAVDTVRNKFNDSKVKTFLQDVEDDLNLHVDIFKNKQQAPDQHKESGDMYLAYRVNLLIDNSRRNGTPIVMETNPNYINLFGSIESTMTRAGFLQTDFTQIKAGSLLKANGGYLVINALDALTETGVWPTLKRTLRNQTLEIQNFMTTVFFNPARLKPEPINIDVKIIMIGDAYVYNLLYDQDEDFKKIFKIKAEFDSETRLADETILAYASFAKKITDQDGLKPLTPEGMAALVEYSIRLAGKKGKMSTRFHHLSDVIREANYCAKKGRTKAISRTHVEKAILERFERVSMIEEKIREMIEEGTIMIDTKGGVIGQVNGLSVYMMGQISFGKPTRITAATSVGRAGVINIEREADMSGRTHNKGVLILGGYLRSKFAQNRPFSLAASIAFEQAYSGVDGDSASSTEVYAILSSLSKLPIRQDIAVTGSLNQKGEIQPIGGVNEKIEGFFGVCKAKKLTGTQGVMIPHQNVKNLMLRKDVVEAVKKGKFHVYPVHTIDEGIEILTGVKAGNQKKDGTYPEGTVNCMVDRELQRLAASWKTFASSGEKAKNSEVE